MVEGGMKCVKYLIFFFNFIFVISGIALVAIGAVIKGYYNKYLDFLGDGVVGAPILLIIVGVVIFFVAFMGCCGAIRESYCMTMTFAVLLALIFILELAAGIAAYVLRDDIRATLDTNMQATMKNYGKDGYDGVTKTWDGVQMEADCCGASNYTDWADYDFGSKGDVPDSCCLESTDGCGAGVLNMTPEEAAQRVHTGGCLWAVVSEVHDNWVWFAVAAAVVIAVELDCCGIANYTDWATTPFGQPNQNVPTSCCKNNTDENCGDGKAGQPGSAVAGDIYTTGCLQKLEQEVVKNIVAVGGAGVGIAFLQILGVILACCLSKSIKKEYETV